jgi:hypothetical protein
MDVMIAEHLKKLFKHDGEAPGNHEKIALKQKLHKSEIAY